MDVLVNKKSLTKYIQREITNSEGKTELEKIKVKNDFYDNVATYIMLDESLEIVKRKQKQWNPKLLDGEGSYEYVLVPVYLTEHQISAMIQRGERVNKYTEETLENHPSKIIARQAAEIERLKKGGK